MAYLLHYSYVMNTLKNQIVRTFETAQLAWDSGLKASGLPSLIPLQWASPSVRESSLFGMKYFIRVGQWMLAVSLMFLLSSVSQRLEADPTADFSFSLTQPRDAGHYQFMSKTHVARILRDHLDLFPISKVDGLAQHLLDLCQEYRFDPNLILSVIRVESAFKIKARSGVGATGLMQLMPATADFVAKKYGIRYTGERSLNDPFTNLSIGIAYLSLLREKYRSVSPYFQFAAYNMGPGRLDMLRQSRGKHFKATTTKDYYEKIRRGVPMFRSYAASKTAKIGA
jgi:hypothetical protein